jgi:hypothetical protein
MKAFSMDLRTRIIAAVEEGKETFWSSTIYPVLKSITSHIGCTHDTKMGQRHFESHRIDRIDRIRRRHKLLQGMRLWPMGFVKML